MDLKKKQFGRKQAWFLYDGDDIRTSNIIALQSYNTIIAIYDREKDCLFESPRARKWSRTTSKQYSQWLSELNFFYGIRVYDCRRIVCPDNYMWNMSNAAYTRYDFDSRCAKYLLDCYVW